MPSPEDRPLPIRPKAAIVMALAAVSMLVGLVAATVGWYVTVQTHQGVAKGARARITFTSACDDAARDVLEARLSDYGLPATPIAGALAFDVTLPGQPDDLAHMPAALAAPGVLAVTVNGTPTPADIDQVGVQLAFSGNPVTLLMLEAPLPQDHVVATIDGAPVEIEAVNGTEMQLAARAGQSTEALRIATDRAVALRHPLPCPVQVVSAEPLSEPAR